MGGFAAKSFDERLEALVAQTGGAVPVREIGRIVASLIEGLDGAPAAPVQAPAADTARELESLLAVIHQTQTEIAALGPAELTTERIPHANDQLRSVVDATEQATGVFLDIAEELEALASTFAGDGAPEIRAIATRIYEASNFQDITGQRITKVTETLGIIEKRLARLVEIGASAGHMPPAAPPLETASGDGTDSHLLNGPQLPDTAATQDDIDRLFASL